MSYAADELKGIMPMMPAFATPDAGDIRTKNTIDVDNLRDGVDRAIRDGIQNIVTTSGSGEGMHLLKEEYQTLVRATLDTVKKRVPVFFGVTSTNPREVVERIEMVRDMGGEGVVVGVPYYHHLRTSNVIKFYQTIAELFPDVSISLYHNPAELKVHIPVAAYKELTKNPNIVAQKDSHRTPLEFMRLYDIIKGKIAHFCNQSQLYPYYEMGASGCWSFDIWMGPWPVLRAYQAAVNGDTETVKRIIKEISAGEGGEGGRYDGAGEGGPGRTPQELAGYIKPGPRRPPRFLPNIDDDKAPAKVARWLELCAKYRSEVEAWRAVHEGWKPEPAVAVAARS